MAERRGANVDILLLGPFEVRAGDAGVDLGDLQQRYTLATLVLHVNRPISAERLEEIVWAGVDKPRSNLIPGYVSRLRKAFRDAGISEQEAAIERAPTGYVLRVDPDRIDAVRFQRLCTEAEQAVQTPRRMALLRTAVDLWRGRYLEDVDIDRVGAAEVISPEAVFLDALGDLAELELAAGNHRWVRDRLTPVLRADPTRQRLAGLVMRALTANGDGVQAMEVYRHTRQALDELGMETSVQLRRLAHQSQRVVPRTTLPPAPRKFTGRDEELAQVEELAAQAADDDRAAVVWISGMPGVGKTAFAVTAGHRMRERFPDGQVLVQLNGFTPNMEPAEAGEALGVLLDALGVPVEQVPRATSQRMALYQGTVAGTRTLVVLDNAASEEQVQSLLPAAPGCMALVTSRRVDGADDLLHLEPLPAEQAATMFGELVGAARVSGHRQAVAEVVARCGFVPLQIRMLAGQLRLHQRWPVEHLAGLLAESGPWQSESPATLACTVSYQQLTEAQQTLFRLFGQVPGTDLSVPAVAALAGCTVARARELLGELQAVSLIEETAPERYLMLDPLKEYADAALPPDDPGERVRAVAGLLDFYLVSVASAMRVLFPMDRDRQPDVHRESPMAHAFTDQADARIWLEAERWNLLAAVRYAASHGHLEHTWQLAVLMWRWNYARGRLDDWSETLELARRGIESAGGEVDRQGLAYVLLRLAGAHRQAGRPAQSLELAARALALWRGLGDSRGAAAALCSIALVTMDRGDYRSAIAHFEAALEDYREIGDERGQANALSNLGNLNELEGELELAERRHVEAAALLQDLDHPQGLAHTLDNLGTTRQRLGRLDEALADHDKARHLAAAVGDRNCEAYAVNNIGNVHRLRGDPLEALRWHERAKQAADGMSDPGLRTQLYLDRGATLSTLGRHPDALTAYLGALDLAAGTGDKGQQAHADHGAARTLHLIGKHDQAADHWERAITAFTALGWPQAADVRTEREVLTCACTGI